LPFVTDKQAQGGTGLGLSVTYGLVQAHGGDITFDTRQGKGTTFTIALPTVRKGESAKILIVDDDQTIRAMLTEALTLIQSRTFLIEEASNGIEASIKLGTYRPDLLILDIFMPEMDGLEVCRIIKNEPELSNMKVLISTGYPEHTKLDFIAKLGFDNVIYKPFDLAEFVKRVEMILTTD
jgi:CheY-like chemotaxis protein